MAILSSLTDGSAVRSSQWGAAFESSLVVYDLSLAEAEVQLDNAILETGYVIGDQHPIFPQYNLVAIDGQHDGPTSVKVSLSWEYRFPEIQYEINATVVNEQTNLDKDGEVITVSYTYPDTYIERPDLVGSTDTTSLNVDKYYPETSLTVTRQESITGVNLVEKSRAYTGTVNETGWTLIPASLPRDWLCTGITGSSSDNGKTYAVRYSFSYRQTTYYVPPAGSTNPPQIIRGWDKQVIFEDPRTDEPPADAEVSVYKIYPETDFNALGLV
jgi:hypothetical protein